MFFSHVELFVFAIIQTQKKTTVQAKILGNLTTSLKPSQNKKGQKNFQLHRFLNAFSQLPAVKKDSKNGAAGKIFCPSYFDPALDIQS